MLRPPPAGPPMQNFWQGGGALGCLVFDPPPPAPALVLDQVAGSWTPGFDSQAAPNKSPLCLGALPGLRPGKTPPPGGLACLDLVWVCSGVALFCSGKEPSALEWEPGCKRPNETFCCSLEQNSCFWKQSTLFCVGILLFWGGPFRSVTPKNNDCSLVQRGRVCSGRAVFRSGLHVFVSFSAKERELAVQ